MLKEVMQIAIEGLLYSSFSLQSRCVHTEDSGKLVVLIGSLRDIMRSECPTGKFCNFLAIEVLIMKPTPERRRSSLFFSEQKRV